MYSRHGQWGSNTMAKNKNKQQSSNVSGRKAKNMKKQMKRREGKEGNILYAPVNSSRTLKTGVPDISHSGSSTDGRTRVRHREYIDDVNGSEAFAIMQYPINPGMKQTFPWLSAFANRYESYVFRRLRFEYETATSSMTNGSVMMAVDYDAADAAPTSKRQLMSYHNAVRSGAWTECCFSGDQMDLRKFGIQRYVRRGPLSSNLDIKTYDVGNFFLATKGEADSSMIGELYVTYDVELITPQLPDDDGETQQIITCALAATNDIFANASSSGPDEVSVLLNTITFRDTGNFQVLILGEGTGFNGNNFSPTMTNGSLVPPFPWGTTSSFIGPFDTEGTMVYFFQITQEGATAVFPDAGVGGANVCTTWTSCKISVIPY